MARSPRIRQRSEFRDRYTDHWEILSISGRLDLIDKQLELCFKKGVERPGSFYLRSTTS